MLGVPCFTVRETTERPVTVLEGTNVMAWDPATLPGLVRAARRVAHPRIPEGWDGRAGERIVEALLDRRLSRAVTEACHPKTAALEV